MPVTKEHPQYITHLPRWQKYRDFSDGEEAVKQGGERYLPKKSSSQTPAEYEAYKQRATFFPAASRAVEGITGLLNRRPADLEYPEAMQPIIDDVTMDGISFEEFKKKCVEEIVMLGRGGVLVDYPPAREDITSLRDAERAGNRPYATYYAPEAIINWDDARGADNRKILTLVVLRETELHPKSDDEFEKQEIEQYRVLDMDDGRYRQRIFRKVKDDSGRETWAVADEIWPTMNGEPLPYIPFEFLGPETGLTDVKRSPIAHITNVNASHYRTMADLENGRHWCGSPTPFFSGDFITSDGDEVTTIKLGSDEGIHMTSGSEAKFLEFTGSGLSELVAADKDKREMMAVLATRILAAEKRQAEAAETARIHRAGEESSIASIAQSVSKSLTRVLEYLRDWGGFTGDVVCSVNTDFIPIEMTPQELTAVGRAWMEGIFSAHDVYWRLKQGEMLSSGKTFDEWQEDLQNDPKPLGLLGGGFE